MTATVGVSQVSRLEPAQVDQVLALTRAAGDADGAYPLSEHVVLHLRHGGDAPAVHLIVERDARLVGYAHVDTTDAVAGASAELVVHPMYRRQGLGRALVVAATAAALAADPTGRLRLWAHGDHPSATALALSLGFERWRVLLQMRRSLYAPVPAPVWPDGVSVRSFEPGRDDEQWVDLNNRVFAGHPDQSRWTLADLRVRMTEPWFDRSGFLLAERGCDLIGFHWTKVHGSIRSDEDGHQHDPIGEVYVLGVDPQAHGLGLGAALTLAGLRHLRSAGLDQAMLYVDETNTTAVALYRRLDFANWSTDICFRRRLPDGGDRP